MIRARLTLLLGTVLLAASFAACGDDPSTAGAEQPDGAAPTPPESAGPLPPCPVPERTLDKWGTLPGLSIAIRSVTGGSGAGGNLAPGDTVSVTFAVGTAGRACRLPLEELDSVGVWIAGPTTGYQRVLPISTIEKRDNAYYDASAATLNADGTYTFTLPDKIPATYGPPLWDTPKFSEGELTGKLLVDGTYAVAVRTFRKYTAGREELIDPATDLRYVLLGAASAIDPNELVTNASCNVCHTQIQRHSGIIRDVRLCVTCHTAGSEDGNSTDTNDATPVTTEFGVMIHKIHAGKHLPSVLGVKTNPDGSRKYDAPPVRYVVGSSRRDFSGLGFPVGPGYRIPTPRDRGYSTLTPAQQALEDAIRTGPTACDKCHGDPDGAGPLPAPAQSDRVYTKMTRRGCGSCHDDVDWALPYTANGQTQDPQPTDSGCEQCHKPSGDAMAVKDAHLHPLKNPAFNPGLVFAVQSLGESGANNGNGKLDPGEKIVVSFTIKDGAGADVPASALSGMSMVVTGPTNNRQGLLTNTAVPLAAMPSGPVLTTHLPEPIALELVGTAADDGTIESFVTARTPHWNVTGALTDVYERTGTAGGSTTLTAPARAGQNFVDVASTASFARNDYVVLDDAVAGAKEVRQLLFVDGQRLWLNGPLRSAHAPGAAAQEIALAKKAAGTFTVTAASGTVSEAAAGSFGAGHDVFVSYTSDFVVPAVYPPPANDSPDLDETWGEWAGKSVVPGTYTFGVWGSRSLVANADWGPDSTSYRTTSVAAMKDFLVGDATTTVPYGLVSSGESCNTCHEDLWFHGAQRRGFEGCVLCHGNAGAEDRPRYVAANAPATPGVTINFRGLVHKMHMGSRLQAGSYAVVAYGSGAYPNNFVTNTFGQSLFPVKPGGVEECTKCHGKLNKAWLAPASRNHPSQQSSPARTWRATCGSCHDSTAASAHIDLQTSSQGEESCAVCHGPTGEYAVGVSHKSW